MPLVVGRAIDDLTAGRQLAALWHLDPRPGPDRALLPFAWRLLLIGTARRIERELRAKLYATSWPCPPRSTTRREPATSCPRTNDVEAVTRACGFGVITIIDPLVMIPVSLGVMLSIDVRMTLYAAIPLPILTVVMLTFGKVIHRRFERVQEAFLLGDGEGARERLRRPRA